MNQVDNTKELRNFGFLVGGVFAIIGVWPIVIRGEEFRLWAVVLGGLLIFLGGLTPSVLAPVHKVWMWIGHVLGWINTRILLGIVFFGLITPMGLLFRIFGKDLIKRDFIAENTTYRVSKSARPPGHMKYQF